MTPEEFIRTYPRLYHMAEEGSWESIKEHGLLSTGRLLDLFGYTGDQRQVLESQRRPESIRIANPDLGQAVIRDQKPMTDSHLLRCLIGLAPEDWYHLLNQRVFFWVTKDRLIRLLNARAYRDKAHDVLTLDTTALVKRYADQITLSPINSGCTKPNPQPRGLDTFLPIPDYPFDQWRKKRRSAQKAVVEMAVTGGVYNVEELAMRVERMRGDQVLHTVFARPG